MEDFQLRRQLDEMREEIRDLRAIVSNLPVRFANNTPPITTLIARGVLVGSLSSDGSASFEITKWDEDSSTWISYDPENTALVRDPGYVSTTLPADTVIWCNKAFGVWWIVAADCPEES